MDERVHIPIGSGDHLIEAMISRSNEPDTEFALKVHDGKIDLVITSYGTPSSHITRRITIADFKYANALLDSMVDELHWFAGKKGD